MFEGSLMTVESRKGTIEADIIGLLEEKLEPPCAKIVRWPDNERKIVIFGGRWAYATLCELVHKSIMVHYYGRGDPALVGILCCLKMEDR